LKAKSYVDRDVGIESNLAANLKEKIKMNKERYFVDIRVGCVAIRDKENTDPDYPGLHSDTKGVIFYKSGKFEKEWNVESKDIEEAYGICSKLNEENNGN